MPADRVHAPPVAALRQYEAQVRALSHQAITVVDTVSKQASQGSLAPAEAAADAPAADAPVSAMAVDGGTAERLEAGVEAGEEEAAATAATKMDAGAAPEAETASGTADTDVLWAQIAAALPPVLAPAPRCDGKKRVYDKDFLMRYKGCNKCPEELLNWWNFADLQASKRDEGAAYAATQSWSAARPYGPVLEYDCPWAHSVVRSASARGVSSWWRVE